MCDLRKRAKSSAFLVALVCVVSTISALGAPGSSDPAQDPPSAADMEDALTRMAALAKEENSQVQVYSSDFLQKHNLGSASSVQRAVSRLMIEEILEKLTGGYQFTDIFFKRWIRNEVT